MKGQWLVIQFVLFFLIGLTIFIAIGNLFKLRADIFREDVANSTRKLINSFVSSLVVSSFTCKECEYSKISVKLENTTAEYFFDIYLNNSGINVVSQPGGKNYLSSAHNLNSTLNFSGHSTSVKTITLTKTQNKLEVS
jgi:hypothetical protein